MKTFISTLLLIVINFVTAQTKENDYFSFYKGGSRYLKPVKYLFFDIANGNVKKVHENKIYFYMDNQTFIFISSKHKIDTCTSAYLKKTKNR